MFKLKFQVGIKTKIISLTCLLILSNFSSLPLAIAQEPSIDATVETLQLPLVEDRQEPAPQVLEPIIIDLPEPEIKPEPVSELLPIDLPELALPLLEAEEIQTTQDEVTPGDIRDKKIVNKNLGLETDNNTGALVYAFDLVVPKGRAEMQPDLKLVYNSQDKNIHNFVGFGWSLNIPSIERMNKHGVNKLYIDNYFSSSLSGELVPVQLSDGVHGTYAARVETGDNLLYEFLVSNEWQVKDKLGKVYKFGASASSRQDNPNDTSKVFKWMLASVRDTNDNYIKYQYYKESNNIFIDQIIYTGSGATDGIFEVKFIRESRPDSIFYYSTGFAVTDLYRLDQAQIYIEGNLKKVYDLNYDLSISTGNRSLLASITEQAQDEQNQWQSLPPYEFAYEQRSNQWLESSNTLPGAAATVSVADLNNDGLQDFFSAPNSADMNNGQGGFNTTAVDLPFDSGMNFRDYVLADYNGDMLIDFLSNDSHTGINLNMGNTTWEYAHYNIPFGPFNELDQYKMVLEVNGDGLPDVVEMQTDWLPGINNIYLNKGDDTGFVLDNNYHLPDGLVLTGFLQFIDVNGDGLVDIFGSGDSDHIYINNGVNGWDYTDNPNFYAVGNYECNDPQLGEVRCVKTFDINGDNLTDIIQSGRQYDGSQISNIWVNKGNGNWSGYYATSSVNFGSIYTKTGDIDGNGLTDLLDFANQKSFLNKTEYYHDTLTTVKDTSGSSAKISYQPVRHFSADPLVANNKLPFAVNALSEILVNDGLGNLSSTTYKFGGGKYYFANPTDKKFAGFKTVTKLDNLTKNISYYHQADGADSASGELNDSYAQIGKAYKTEVRDKASDELLQVENIKWETTDLGSGRELVLNTQQVKTDLSGTSPVSTAKQMSYDTATGNLLTEENLGKVTTDSSSGEIINSLTGDEKTTDYQYAINTSKHILAAPKNTEISSATENKDQDLYYDNLALGSIDKVNLTKEDYKHDGTEVNRNFNSLGLVTQEVDPKGATTTVAYDTLNLYPVSATNALNQTTLSQYDLLNGQVVSNTNPSGSKQLNSFDALGRPTKVEISDALSANDLNTKQEIVYQDQAVVYETELGVDDNTIALWHLNGFLGDPAKNSNAEGTFIYDVIAHNINSTASGFDGANNGTYNFIRNDAGYLDVLDNDHTNLDLNHDFTIEAWINFASLVPADELRVVVNKTDQYLVGYRNDASGLGYGGIYGFLSDGTLKMEKSVNQSTLWPWSPNINQWYYLAVSYDQSAGTMEVFINGKSLGLKYNFPSTIYNGSEPFKIGAIGGTTAWDGAIDEVRLSNKIRSSAEIQAYYSQFTGQYNDRPRYKESKDYFTDTQYVTAREYYDGLDRVIQKKSQQAGSQWTTVDIIYDLQGRVVRQSLPYNTATLDYTSPDATKPAKTYIYDVLDRVVTETNPTGSTTYEYDGLTTKITDASGHLKELSKDAYGNLAQVKEYNGANIYTTNYEYTLINKLKKITDSAGNIRNFSYDALDNLEWQDMVHKPSVTTPAKIQYTYDKNGNVLTETSFKNDAISYTYDNLNRPSLEKLSGATKISYTYDQNSDVGQLSLADYGNGNSKAYNYDVLGRVLTATTTIANENFVLKYEYNLAGALSKIIYPNNQQIIYGFNNIGQVNLVSLNKGQGTTILASNIEYNQNGQMIHLERVNGVITDYTYDPNQAFRLTRILSVNATATLQDLNYIYDALGNILTIQDNANTDLQKIATYTYDDLNRLLSTTVIYTNHPDKNYTQTFTYDSIGNMTSNSDLGVMSYTNGQPHQLTSYGTRTFIYDLAGNMRGNKVTKFAWDWRNRMVNSFDIATAKYTNYAYDHNNQRFLKYTEEYIEEEPIPMEQSVGSREDNLISMQMISDHELQVTSQDKYVDQYYEKNLNNQTKSHVFLNNVKLATINNNDEPYYILSDHLSSSSILTDSTGATVQLTDYQPYGKINYDNKLIDLKSDYTFTGKELDKESSLQYYGARYMDNEIGKFTSVDPVIIKVDSLSKILSDPQSLNSYVYTRNNPVILVDKDGNFWQIFTAGIGAVGGSVWGAKDSYNMVKNTFQGNFDAASYYSESYLNKVGTGMLVGLGVGELARPFIATYAPQVLEKIEGQALPVLTDRVKDTGQGYYPGRNVGFRLDSNNRVLDGANPANGTYKTVIRNNNVIFGKEKSLLGGGNDFSHADLVNGENVNFAGTMRFKNGQLQSYNEWSGHYQGKGNQWVLEQQFEKAGVDYSNKFINVSY